MPCLSSCIKGFRSPIPFPYVSVLGYYLATVDYLVFRFLINKDPSEAYLIFCLVQLT